ncbi:DUF3087 domain-containing protein [Paraglaciecola sp. L3A3]|uniref:DUF3087 domain-containing protein n=1 Tax=Paraglaciecola sp. L3A3 TaxID=2686358 RepID=UPI00131B0A3F|nr:DUF3087 domain-containing protein [Paraglaciecola sp. L3A3]
MQLIGINKTRYRKHLNIVITACIASLIIGCLGISQLLIHLFPDESGSHFHWNLAGVVITCISIAWVLHKYRQHDFMTEVVYVWELKQSLTKINRKMLKLKAASKKGNVDALLALHYCYAGSRQLWELDDNTIVMDELAVQQAELDVLAEQYNVTLHADDYDPTTLKQF